MHHFFLGGGQLTHPRKFLGGGGVCAPYSFNFWRRVGQNATCAPLMGVQTRVRRPFKGGGEFLGGVCASPWARMDTGFYVLGSFILLV